MPRSSKPGQIPQAGWPAIRPAGSPPSHIESAPEESNGKVPDGLQPYTFHGLDLEVRGKHGVGDCPFCGGEGKFSADCESGLWRCFVCGTGTEAGGGNALVFLRTLHELAQNTTTKSFLQEVAKDRRLCSPDTVAAWGVCRSPIAPHNWLVPGYGPDGRMDQLYRRTKLKDKRGQWYWALLPTPGVWPHGRVHALHMPSAHYDPDKAGIAVCEGPWDGMALWEVLREELGQCNVLAAPGCNIWRDEWTAMCRGKSVFLPFDSDHPRQEGVRSVQAGRDGVARVAKRLSGTAASVSWLRWGPEGYDPDKPDGWDVRDALSGAPGEPLPLAERRHELVALLRRVEHCPADWFTAGQVQGVHAGNGHHTRVVESRPCHDWATCEGAWREALRWRQTMGDTMAVLLAVCASTQQSGNQLFFQCVGSAGSGKTTMCEGLLVSQHCHHLEHLTGFHSGWRGEDGEDCSLIARVNGKTLVTPEADIMMSSRHFQEIMSQQRRIFDGKSGATYKNSAMDTLHVGLRTPWIMAGTPALLDTDQSRLGDRFQRIIIEEPNQQEKREILFSAVDSEMSAMLEVANGTAGGIVDPKTRKAHALTGGYVDWLRANVEEKIVLVHSSIPKEAKAACVDLAEMSADLRARPNRDKRKEEVHDSKELPTRLARQNIRLACHLAVVLNKSVVDQDVLRIVRKVALDTAHGHSLDIAMWLCSRNPKSQGGDKSHQECGGIGESTLAAWCNMSQDRMSNYLGFLRKIGVLEPRSARHSSSLWSLTDRAYELYTRIMGNKI